MTVSANFFLLSRKMPNLQALKMFFCFHQFGPFPTRFPPIPILIPALIFLMGCGGDGGLSHGYSFGDISENSALLWARGQGEGYLLLDLKSSEDQSEGRKFQTRLTSKDDYTARLEITGLRPDTRYDYTLRYSRKPENDMSAGLRGSFRTAPAPEKAKAVRFVFGGDIAGQNICRDKSQGMPVFSVIASRKPDFFIGLGDLIYADSPCLVRGTFGNDQIPGKVSAASTLEEFRQKWRYSREDRGLRELLMSVPYYAIWDDHDTRNDVDPKNDLHFSRKDAPGIRLLPLGLRAFLDYNPVSIEPDAKTGMYRRFRRGKNLEFFILDTRSFRDPNKLRDTAPRPKTMLGAAQMKRLRRDLKNSDALWKIIVSSVPMSIPTGTDAPALGRDGWANYESKTGYERELLGLLKFMKREGIRNNLWITTDVHFAAVFRYRPFGGDFLVHEAITGPLNAGLFPNQDFDKTLNPERLFHYGPPGPNQADSFAAALQWFNFGLVEIDVEGVLTLKITSALGKDVYKLSLKPAGK